MKPWKLDGNETPADILKHEKSSLLKRWFFLFSLYYRYEFVLGIKGSLRKDVLCQCKDDTIDNFWLRVKNS